MKKTKKLLLLRLVLGALILLNMAIIFAFSAQSGTESDQTSGRVTRIVADIFVKDFDEKTQKEQEQILQEIHPYIRKLAHMSEFGLLGALIFLFLLTWKEKLLLRYASALFSTFLYACSDELHQILSDARGPQFSDVLIDLCGAILTCSFILAICLILKRKKKGEYSKRMKTTYYRLNNGNKNIKMRIAVASDLHGERHDKVIQALQEERPDLILIPGDLLDDKQLSDMNASGYDFLQACALLAPTFYSVGNHEIACYHRGNPWRHPTPLPLPAKVKERIKKTGAILLDNDCIKHDNMWICGLTSGINGKKNHPDQKVLDKFAKLDGFRILLCHHPEYFVPYIQKTDIELTVSGHAHGGQWRVFGRGVYAPGQGIFPKYTSGVLENRCVISRGLGNHTHIPRFFNPRELVIIEINQ